MELELLFFFGFFYNGESSSSTREMSIAVGMSKTVNLTLVTCGVHIQAIVTLLKPTS